MIFYKNKTIRIIIKFDCIIFDWDGTLADSIEPLAIAFNTTCETLGVDKPNQYLLRRSFGNHSPLILKQLLAKDVSDEEFNVFVGRYNHWILNTSTLEEFDHVVHIAYKKQLIHIESKDKNLLYISGETISSDLDNQLSKDGFNIKRIINYRAIHNLEFDENFVKQLKLNIPDIVYIYSENSALSFLNFIKIIKSENLWMNTNLMCIGEKTSKKLNEIKWKKIFLFNPGEEEFLLYKI